MMMQKRGRPHGETSQVLLAGVSGGFPGVPPFRPTFRLARLDMCEIILEGTFKKTRTGFIKLCICILINVSTYLLPNSANNKIKLGNLGRLVPKDFIILRNRLIHISLDQDN